LCKKKTATQFVSLYRIYQDIFMIRSWELLIRSWELLCWILTILITWSRYPLWALVIWGSIKIIPFHIFLVIPPMIQFPSIIDWVSRYDNYAGYRIKIKLICRLTKDQDQALLSISTIREFHAQVPLKTLNIFLSFNKPQILNRIQ